MSRLTIAVLIAGIIGSPTIVDAQPSPTAPRPVEMYIHPGVRDPTDVLVADVSDAQYFLASMAIEDGRASAKAGQNPRAWVDVELKTNHGTPEKPYYSVLFLFEFNCQDHTYRQLADISYAASLLEKPYPPLPRPPGPWNSATGAKFAQPASALVCETSAARP